ncbi:MAG: formate dehydrogenase accessory sulfurtransferase FdhD [Anaerolineales bacterium]|nr:formate dehydrogenase accessory sulfurtransferase FdhD [Anaerolineales bacterium]MCB9127598.1 formate dehydrogenase accessory sulfurtransferase FdhD [Ardenticatenales bacterium]
MNEALGWPTHYWAYVGDAGQRADKGIMRETPWPLFVNGREWLTMMATPTQLERLAVGFLYNEGVIASLDELLSVRICEHPAAIIDVRLVGDRALPAKRTLTSGCGGGITFGELAESRPPLPVRTLWQPATIYAGMSNLLATVADDYRAVGGFHSSAWVDGDGAVRVVANDVGRHNTIDKLAGAVLLHQIDLRGLFLVSTGRISSEMITKAAGLGVEMVVSRNSPTATTVQLARAWQITVIGYCRGQRMHVYSAPERLAMPRSH